MVSIVEKLLEAVEAIEPHRLQLVEQALRPTHGVDVAPHELLATAAVLQDEIGTFEHGDVLLHGGEAHVVATSECRDRTVADHRAPHDVAARAIRERLEQPVHVVVAQSIYNHMVAD